MINIEDVLKLKEAGFTADEIVNLHKAMEPFEDPESAPETGASPDRTDEILEALKTLTATVQASNIRTSGEKPPEKDSLEDILNFAMNGGK